MTDKPMEMLIDRPVTRRWIQMGAELEGGWPINPSDVAAKVRGARAHRDGSLRNFVSHVGEITTTPHALLENLLSDIEKLHPEEVNETAGFHIHASFTPMETSLLTTQDFWDYFRMRWEGWGKANEGAMTKRERTWFWNRFYERTPDAQQYCAAKFQPGQQLADHSSGRGGRNKGDSRYTQLNFNSYHNYKTVECRLLPMFETKSITLLATQELSDIYDTFLGGQVDLGIKMDKKLQAGETGEIQEIIKIKGQDLTPWQEERKVKGTDLPYGPGICYHIQGAQDLMLPFIEDAGVSL